MDFFIRGKFKSKNLFLSLFLIFKQFLLHGDENVIKLKPFFLYTVAFSNLAISDPPNNKLYI